MRMMGHKKDSDLDPELVQAQMRAAVERVRKTVAKAINIEDTREEDREERGSSAGQCLIDAADRCAQKAHRQ